MEYDSTVDTLDHIKKVNRLLIMCVQVLLERANTHDNSKLLPPEKEYYDKYTPILKGLTYGSEEYKENLKVLGEGLKHHYANNSHHPEHYPNGINDMNLFDVLEMLCDWKAATMRHTDGNIYDSLLIGKIRFNISEQLYLILKNTVDEYL